MKKRLLLTVLLFCFTLLTSAQNKSITLKLIDSKTGAPIEKAGCLTLGKEKTTGTLSGKDGISLSDASETQQNYQFITLSIRREFSMLHHKTTISR